MNHGKNVNSWRRNCDVLKGLSDSLKHWMDFLGPLTQTNKRKTSKAVWAAASHREVVRVFSWRVKGKWKPCSVPAVWARDSLSQVSAGARLLGPVGLGDAEGVAQRWYAGLQVELGRLSQVRLLAEVVEVKERGAAFHLSLHQGGRSDLHTQQKENCAFQRSKPSYTQLGNQEYVSTRSQMFFYSG